MGLFGVKSTVRTDFTVRDSIRDPCFLVQVLEIEHTVDGSPGSGPLVRRNLYRGPVVGLPVRGPSPPSVVPDSI